MSRPPAVILAGGSSTRMGGGDKCLLQLGGRPLLSLIVERLAHQAAPVALNANGEPDRFAAFALPVIADDIPHRPGPLAGLLAAMGWAAGIPAAEAVATVAGDTPFFPLDLVERLGAAHAGSGLAALARSGGRLHPVFGLWPLSRRQTLADHLAAGGTRRMTGFADAIGYVAVDFDGAAFDPFFNVNTPQDRAEAERLFGGAEQR